MLWEVGFRHNNQRKSTVFSKDERGQDIFTAQDAIAFAKRQCVASQMPEAKGYVATLKRGDSVQAVLTALQQSLHHSLRT